MQADRQELGKDGWMIWMCDQNTMELKKKKERKIHILKSFIPQQRTSLNLAGKIKKTEIVKLVNLV